MATPRSLLIAIWIFCVNFCYAIFNQLDPFNLHMELAYSQELISSATSAANQTGYVTGWGVAEAVQAFNMFIDIILGPLTLVPTLLNSLGVTGLINAGLTGVVYFMYAVLIFQLLTGRMLRDAL